MRDHILDKECIVCHKTYAMDEVELTCPACGIEGILDVRYDYDLIRDQLPAHLAKESCRDIFRYAHLLPLRRDGRRPQIPVGQTPLYQADRLAGHLGMSSLYVKDDGRLPTASFKDRASAIAVARAHELNIGLICAASTGNAAASLAGLTAPEGITSVIFVPESAPPAKIAQLLTFGAKVFAVRGTYDDAFELSLLAAERYGWYSRSTAVNPILSEGKKTGTLELMEQLGFDNPPDTILVSVGDGCIIGGLAKGLKDLWELGMIPTLPRLIGVQAEGSRVIHDVFHSGSEVMVPVAPTTRADSISVAWPRDWLKAVRGVRWSQGTMVTVTDQEIFQAGLLLGRFAGVFAEPAGATPAAGLVKLLEEGVISPTERVALFVTGNGLKDVAGASMAAGSPMSAGKLEEGLRDIEQSGILD